jgi:copper resistance protein B
MKQFLLITITSLMLSTQTLAGGKDDPLLTMVNIQKFELQDVDNNNPLVIEADAWLGKDLNKLWVKTEIERVNGVTEEAELQLLYSKALYPFWDLQMGWRRDFEPQPQRNWLVLGLQGLAPYMFEVDAALFIGEAGRMAFRLDAEYEYLFTQRWIMSPEIEMNVYSKDGIATGIGSGLADLSAGLRLRYEIRREFAPYIGINWNKQFAGTAGFSKTAGDNISDTQLVMGIRAWF